MLKAVVIVSVLSFLAQASFAQDAREIIKKAEENAKGKTSVAEITIQTIRPNWSREMSLKAWTKGNDYSMLLIQSPEKEKGVVYLKQKKEVWNWIPAIERTVKLPPSMMSQSWMGTDFTNDDLVKEASILDDYYQALLNDTVIDGKQCYKIKLDPKPTSTVVWGKVLMSVDTLHYLMLHVEYFDEDGEMVNTMHCSNIQKLGGRFLPARMEMIPSDKKGNKTVLMYTSIVFDTPIEDSFFTTQNMTRIK